jgi:hypothetical protein
MTGTADASIRNDALNGRNLANASGWIREHQRVMLNSNDLVQLRALPTPSVADRGMKILQELERRHPDIGSEFAFQFPDCGDTEPDWLAVSWSQSVQEFQFLLVNYLRDEIGAIGGEHSEADDQLYLLNYQITPRGFDALDKVRHGSNPQSAIGFCAMWFADDLMPLWTEAIEPAIRNAGYEPKRIDQHEHANRIDDEIVAMIRRSRFVVADFTGQRGGVYFESGFALGLGLRVIWICRGDELSNVHFDTRQYNFLQWHPGAYADLATRLQNRIEATLGHGPRA